MFYQKNKTSLNPSKLAKGSRTQRGRGGTDHLVETIKEIWQFSHTFRCQVGSNGQPTNCVGRWPANMSVGNWLGGPGVLLPEGPGYYPPNSVKCWKTKVCPANYPTNWTPTPPGQTDGSYSLCPGFNCHNESGYSF